MDNLSPVETAVVVFGAIMVIASAINTLGSAIEKIVKAFKAAKVPDTVQNNRLAALEADMKDVKDKLNKDYLHLNALDEGNRVTQRALLALLAHGIDGNNVAQMESAKEALEEHLISR